MDRLPHFYDISPWDIGFCCIHPCNGEDYRRCTSIVNQSDRRMGDQTKARIVLLEPPLGEPLKDVLAYAELCCCKFSRRRNAKKLGRLRRAAVTWLAELIGPLNATASEACLALGSPPRFFKYESIGHKDDLSDSFLSTLKEH